MSWTLVRSDDESDYEYSTGGEEEDSAIVLLAAFRATLYIEIEHGQYALLRYDDFGEALIAFTANGEQWKPFMRHVSYNNASEFTEDGIRHLRAMPASHCCIIDSKGKHWRPESKEMQEEENLDASSRCPEVLSWRPLE